MNGEFDDSARVQVCVHSVNKASLQIAFTSLTGDVL